LHDHRQRVLRDFEISQSVSTASSASLLKPPTPKHKRKKGRRKQKRTVSERATATVDHNHVADKEVVTVAADQRRQFRGAIDIISSREIGTTEIGSAGRQLSSASSTSASSLRPDHSWSGGGRVNSYDQLVQDRVPLRQQQQNRPNCSQIFDQSFLGSGQHQPQHV